MKISRSRRRLFWAAAGLALALLAAGLTWRLWPRGVWTQAEIIRYPFGDGDALAADESGALFTFTVPQNAPADLAPGDLVTLTGPDYWLYSSPMIYQDVKKVERTGSRPDFVALYYQQLAQLPAADRERAIQDLADLNAGEKAGLAYLLEMEN